MPGLIAVSEFVEETREDYNSPTTSTFVSRMPQCRQTITSLEEVISFPSYIFRCPPKILFSRETSFIKHFPCPLCTLVTGITLPRTDRWSSACSSAWAFHNYSTDICLAYNISSTMIYIYIHHTYIRNITCRITDLTLSQLSVR